MLLERCCTTLAQVSEAVENGAGRIELCSDIKVGGLTPDWPLLKECVSLGIPVNVLVRPRPGNFVYSAEEVGLMLEDIDSCRELGAAGVVVGALTAEDDVDMDVMMRLVGHAKSGPRPLTVTFHRAFDECREPFVALEQIISLGCERILTSGGRATAYEGRELLSELVSKAGERIIIMPGSGVIPDNLDFLERFTGAVEFHGTRLCAGHISK